YKKIYKKYWIWKIHMMKYIHYILSPLFYLSIAMAGRIFTTAGVHSWYPGLVKPDFTPPGSIIGIVWTVIYILSALSLILFVNAARGKSSLYPVISLYAINGILNALWSYIFFTRHMLGLAVVDAVLIGITVALIIVFVYRYSKAATLLLIPYLLWVTFASYLTYVIYRMN
ncbi:MAG: tryptophan-rich sensory protein, partial [Nitrospiraceae bacterium]